MPTNYSNWKKSVILDMCLQCKPLNGKSYFLLITLIGKHCRRGDLDNVAGSIMDALVQAGIIKNDNMTVIQKLNIELQYSKKDPIVEIVLIENQS
jgi:Holliday junction resolvase RusA-like endonuclease